MLFLDNEDIFDEESKVGSATISTAERGMKIGLTSEPTGARRGQGDDEDGGYATGRGRREVEAEADVEVEKRGVGGGGGERRRWRRRRRWMR